MILTLNLNSIPNPENGTRLLVHTRWQTPTYIHEVYIIHVNQTERIHTNLQTTVGFRRNPIKCTHTKRKAFDMDEVYNHTRSPGETQATRKLQKSKHLIYVLLYMLYETNAY